MKALEQVAVRAADVEELAGRRQVDQAEQIFEQDFRARAAAERRAEQALLFARRLVIERIARVDVRGEAAPVAVEHLLDGGAARAYRPGHARFERLRVGGNETARPRGGVHRLEPGRIADVAGRHGYWYHTRLIRESSRASTSTASDDFAELARLCAAQARLTNSREVAHAPWKMA